MQISFLFSAIFCLSFGLLEAVQHLKIEKDQEFKDKLQWMHHLVSYDDWSGRPTNMKMLNAKFNEHVFIAALRAHNFGIVWYEYYMFEHDEDILKIQELKNEKQCSDIYWRCMKKNDFDALCTKETSLIESTHQEKDEFLDWVMISKEK